MNPSATLKSARVAPARSTVTTRLRPWWLALAGLVALTGTTLAAPPPANVATWVGANLHPVTQVAAGGDDRDLEPLRQLIGDARIVSFGEGLHGAAEPLEFRNRVFRYLVEHLGFSAIAIESGVTEGFVANRYVLGEGRDDDLPDVVSRGFTFGFAQLPQEAELLRWMRDYNKHPSGGRKIEFYGVDVPGSPKDMQSTLWVALDYLRARDATAASALLARIVDLRPNLVLDRGSNAEGQYTELTQADRDRLTGTIDDVIAQFETHEPEYVGATSVRAYAVAYRAALAARQVDDYLRQVPVGWKPKDGPNGLYGTVASADHAKAANLQWVLEQLGPGARVLVFMHRDHLAYTRSTIALPPPINAWTLPPMVGMYLKERYGNTLVTVAHLFATQATACGSPPTRAAPDSFEAVLAKAPAPLFLLDLRTAPPDVAAWLKTDHTLFGVPPLNTTALGNAHDAVFFTRSVSSAVPCSPAP